jgi:hypothetical protein
LRHAVACRRLGNGAFQPVQQRRCAVSIRQLLLLLLPPASTAVVRLQLLLSGQQELLLLKCWSLLLLPELLMLELHGSLNQQLLTHHLVVWVCVSRLLLLLRLAALQLLTELQDILRQHAAVS